MPSTSPWRGPPVSLEPLEGAGLCPLTTPSSRDAGPASVCSSLSSPTIRTLPSHPPFRPRGRRPLRVLYPPSLSRRPPPLKEAPDSARRWLLLLLGLLFLQIYTEEALCTENQSYSSDMTSTQPQEGEGSPGTAWAGTPVEAQWRSESTKSVTTGNQLQCVVA